MENWRRAYASQTVVTCAVLGVYTSVIMLRQFLNHYGGLFWSRSSRSQRRGTSTSKFSVNQPPAHRGNSRNTRTDKAPPPRSQGLKRLERPQQVRQAGLRNTARLAGSTEDSRGASRRP